MALDHILQSLIKTDSSGSEVLPGLIFLPFIHLTANLHNA